MANALLKRERSNVVARSFSATIDGKLIPATHRRMLERKNPATGQLVSSYPKATADDTGAAIAAARRAANEDDDAQRTAECISIGSRRNMEGSR